MEEHSWVWKSIAEYGRELTGTHILCTCSCDKRGVPTHTSSIPEESTPSISFLWSSRNFRCIADICAISRSRRIFAISLLDVAASCDGGGSSSRFSFRGAGKSSILGEPGPLSRHRLRYYDEEVGQHSRTNTHSYSAHAVNPSKLQCTHSKL